MQEKYYYVYIATNKINEVLYIGVTNNIFERGYQHKMKVNINSFTAKYNISNIVYYEIYNRINDAIAREKQLKAGTRKKKLELIIKDNPVWRNLLE